MASGNGFFLFAVDHFNLPEFTGTRHDAPPAVQARHLVFLEKISNALRELGDNAVLALKHFLDIELHAGNGNAVLGKLVLDPFDIFRGFEQGFRRNAPDIKASAAKAGLARLVLEIIHASRIETKLGRANRRNITAGTGADHEYIELLGHGFHL